MKTELYNRGHGVFPLKERAAFSLMEVMVVMGLLTLIIIVLMAVFSNTQAAFRAGVTQTDVMASGRATMELISSDLKLMTPSSGVSNGAVNFTAVTSGYVLQSLPASGNTRTNVLQWMFMVSRENTTWRGIGYAVDVNYLATRSIFPLYRFYAETNLQAGPAGLYTNFYNNLTSPITNKVVWSHLMDGVVNFVVRAYDTNGYWLTNGYPAGNNITPSAQNTFYYAPNFGEMSLYMYSNTVPASVEVQLGVLEDTALRRLESLNVANNAFTNYLSQQAGRVEVFRQRVTIPNLDPTAYQ